MSNILFYIETQNNSDTICSIEIIIWNIHFNDVILVQTVRSSTTKGHDEITKNYEIHMQYWYVPLFPIENDLHNTYCSFTGVHKVIYYIIACRHRLFEVRFKDVMPLLT